MSTGRGCAFASQWALAAPASAIRDSRGRVGVAALCLEIEPLLAQSGIHGEVAAGEVVSGYPAIPNRLWLRCSAAFSKLPEMAKTMRELRRNLPQ